MGDGGGERAEWCFAFAFDEEGAEGAGSDRDVSGARDLLGGEAECCLGVWIERRWFVGEAEFGREGSEACAGAAGGEEGGERFEGAHAANVAGAVSWGRCGTLRVGTNECDGEAA